MKEFIQKNWISGISLIIACLALLAAGGLLFSGNGAPRFEDYQRVAEQVNA